MKQFIACVLLLISSFFMASDKPRYRSSSNESTTSSTHESTTSISSDNSPAAQSIGTDGQLKLRRPKHHTAKRKRSPNTYTVINNEEQNCEKCCAESCIITTILASCGLIMYLQMKEPKSLIQMSPMQ